MLQLIKNDEQFVLICFVHRLFCVYSFLLSSVCMVPMPEKRLQNLHWQFKSKKVAAQLPHAQFDHNSQADILSCRVIIIVML